MDWQIYIIYTARYIINAMRGKKDHSLDIVGLKILALWCRLGRLSLRHLRWRVAYKTTCRYSHIKQARLVLIATKNQ